MLNEFKLEPYEWQKQAIEMSYRLNNMALFADMGTGKTGATVNITRARFGEQQRMMKTLILGPLVTLFNWKNEFGIHSYIKPEKIHVLHGTSAKKLKTFTRATEGIDQNQIMVTNYEAMISQKMLDAIEEWQPEILILDEAHYVKNPKAKRSKAIAKIAKEAKHTYILTGTPILNSVEDIFMQFFIMDGGATFGKDPWVFKRKYMKDENEGWKGRQNYYPQWVPRPEKYKELNEKIYTKAIRVMKDECLDLPPLVKKIMPVELSPSQRKYYEQLKRDFLTFIDEEEKKGIVVTQLAITKALRLQQIVTGHVKTEEGQVIEIKDNPRLKAVKQLLQDLHVEHKVILWCSFKHNYKQLSEVCKELKIEHVFLTGEMNLTEKEDAMHRFNTEGKVRVIIANRKAGGIGINLVASDISIVFSRNFSLGEELQSQDRNYRGGSEIHRVITKIDLCAKDTIDERITEALVGKKDISNKIIELAKEDYERTN
jgi:SNF2 family DNA or RNA helicase